MVKGRFPLNRVVGEMTGSSDWDKLGSRRGTKKDRNPTTRRNQTTPGVSVGMMGYERDGCRRPVFFSDYLPLC